MRAVVQRCDGANVRVGGREIGGFVGPGLLVLVGVTHEDEASSAQRLAARIWGLRIFDSTKLPRTCLPPSAPAEVSASDAGLPLLVISQFTLYGKTKKGRRPTWDEAAPSNVAEPLVQSFADALAGLGATVSTGQFGTDMQVSSVNDGPFTVLVEV